jgi:4-amino-4-deoxy-L-arabinose transferase-like glycosyltransferase
VLPLGTVIQTDYLQAPVFKHPPLFPMMVGLSRLAGGGELAAAFAPNLLLSAMSLLLFFAVCRETRLSPGNSLLAVGLLSLSPVHWVCSARIWLDLAVTTFVLGAAWCQIRGLRHPRWFVAAGFFWGCALLTKYVALAALVGAFVATLYVNPRVVRERWFWVGYLLTITMLMPWLAFRWQTEGSTVIAFWTSDIDDWRRLTRILKHLWVLPVGFAILMPLWRRLATLPESAAYRRHLLWMTGLFVVTCLVNPFGWNYLEVPATFWGNNPFATAPLHFYISRQVLFEPICWVGLTALLLLPLSAAGAWTQIRGVWLSLLIFLTAWGNYQLRYGVILVPWELLGAVALLQVVQKQMPANHLTRALSVAWIVLSAARSVWILVATAIHNDLFYF